jgi:hypothetical protein
MMSLLLELMIFTPDFYKDDSPTGLKKEFVSNRLHQRPSAMISGSLLLRNEFNKLHKVQEFRG